MKKLAILALLISLIAVPISGMLTDREEDFFKGVYNAKFNEVKQQYPHTVDVKTGQESLIDDAFIDNMVRPGVEAIKQEYLDAKETRGGAIDIAQWYYEYINRPQ